MNQSEIITIFVQEMAYVDDNGNQSMLFDHSTHVKNSITQRNTSGLQTGRIFAKLGVSTMLKFSKLHQKLRHIVTSTTWQQQVLSRAVLQTPGVDMAIMKFLNHKQSSGLYSAQQKAIPEHHQPTPMQQPAWQRRDRTLVDKDWPIHDSVQSVVCTGVAARMTQTPHAYTTTIQLRY